MRYSTLSSSFPDSLCAVVVAFHPDNQFHHRLNQIKKICKEVVVVDNSPQPVVGKICSQSLLKDVHLIENNQNLGIGKALNQGVISAFEMGYENVITFDQDSKVSENFSDSFNAILANIDDQLTIVGCNYWDANKRKLRYHCKDTAQIMRECKTVITSGMLINKDVIEKVGLFREDFFIDSVDHEYCLRARKSGVKIYHSCESLMEHEIGQQPSKTRVLPVLAFNHIPLRKYYMARNTLITIASYWRHEPFWAGKQVIRLLVELASILLLETHKRSKLEASWYGIKHAAKHKMGEVSSSLRLKWMVDENKC